MKQNFQDFTLHMTSELISDSDSDSDTDSGSDDEEPEGHYVAGDSLLRDFEHTKVGFSINYRSGPKFSDMETLYLINLLNI